MMLKSTGIVCVALSIVLTLTTGAFAQTSSTDIAGLLAGLTPDQLSLLTNALSGGGTSGLSSLLGGTSTQATTSQPSVSDRVGPPRTMISAAIAEHIQFNNVAFNMTPAQQAAALGITTPPAQVKIPIIFLFKGLIDLGARFIPALQGLSDLLAGITWPGTGNNDNITPPIGPTDKGLVAYVTADDTSLTVGQTTTGRLWVEQTSPTAAKDNGVYSVAVDIDAAPSAIIQSTVPVTLVSPWDVSLIPTLKGTATMSGGITGIGSAQGAIPPNKSLGIGDPIQVATFTITARSAGTATLTPKNFSGSGFTGITPVGSGPSGDEANYVPVEITVQ